MMNLINRTEELNAVIFDLGNVILNWDVDQILESLTVDNEEKHLLREELFYHQDWLDLDHGIQSETRVASNISHRCALNQHTVEFALHTAKCSLTPIVESLSLMQEISDANIEMYCLSNMSRETYQHIRNQAFFRMFNGIVISGIERCMKPNEDIFRLLVHRYELKLQNLLFIDDSLPNVDTAIRLGINGFHFKRSNRCYAKLRELLL